MRREAQNLLLLLVGGALLKTSWDGTYARYVKPGMLPWLVAAGAVVTALAVVAVVRDVRAGRAARSGHGHRSAWLLLLPVLAIFLVVPPPLGADSASRNQSASPPAPESRFPPLPPEPRPLLSVSEFVTRAVWDGNGELLSRQVRLRGFVVHPEPGRSQLVRMRISCCAADASPVRVNLVGPGAAAAERLAEDTWIEVVGTLQPGSVREENGYVPALRATQLQETAAPAEFYEY
ncbi:TIGR03943 family putative permease subunit [Saccharopolyspora rectivirgula]|jgi:uncharacterized repeat protein (TIGR03943 family)|uniref:DUF1980 domain-containing protein n=1 Tax=Saccharopolyspora rectivirgula TaxID=28042 RepID=A0A073AWS1_9PSEU|nr:TIGR03943 family protein [Saccharopolyspora rectivirgula]KEI44208.1 hypothetical protein GU90_12155 [Saccharopolyspora rectivirgula]